MIFDRNGDALRQDSEVVSEMMDWINFMASSHQILGFRPY
jgi:hypothetical protein